MREQLQSASEHLRKAAEVAGDDARERLHDQSNEMAKLATRDRGPDHGRLARHERILDDIAEGESEAVREHVEDALDEITAFRETLEGV